MLPDGIWVGLGGNQSGSEAAMRDAVAALARRSGLRGVSSLYRTAPRDYLDQPDFLNAVAHLDIPAGTEPQAYLDFLLRLERELGRDRGKGAIPKGPRLIDLDLLLYGTRCLRTDRLELPHPAMAGRRFVLDPLLELVPDLDEPAGGNPYRLLRERVAGQAIYSIRPGWYTA
jgi:2-amino-4-hydroxy-6-hydroxymethyldihydropteridine diphosphokinase